MCLFCIMSLVGCKKSDNSTGNNNTNTTNDVTIVTYTPHNITSSSIISGCEVVPAVADLLEEIGVCWGVSSNPTVLDNRLSTDILDESFICTINNLLPNTRYHIRAYALYNSDYYYGEDIKFSTLSIDEDSFLFTVSPSVRVYFSPGNLQYQASTNTWQFAINQYDHIGDANSNISSSYSGWIDLFGWGTGNFPTKTSTRFADYYTFTDWGNNIISNGSGYTWRTLSRDEWMYVFEHRNTQSGILYARAIVNGVNGMILLPDNWTPDIYELNKTNYGGANYDWNRISASDWKDILEPNGAVFLPANGYRSGTDIYHDNNDDGYWSSSENAYDCCYGMLFNIERLCTGCYCYRYRGESVRLVRNAQ